jgi:DNA-binding LytR/AlgR family response regulator
MKIAVCDDENKIVEEITSYIKKDFPVSEVRTYSNGESFLAASEERPEVLLLDIDMPGINGMEVAAALTREKVSTLIVFVTAHDELVYDSFKYHPFAFVRKKFLEEELKTVLSDCEKQLVSRNKNFVFQNASKLVTLSQSDILYFEGQANYLAIHTTSDEYKMRSTMAGVEKELEDSDFLRIHKGFLVNLEHIRVLKTEELELDNGTVLPIGKSYSEAAKKSILKYMRR